MKTMKRFLSSLLVVMLIAAVLVVPASAEEETYKITINGTATGHTYEAYQIFSGSLSTTGVLSNIAWGSGVNGPALLTALQGDDTFKKDDVNQFAAAGSAEAVAKVVAGWANDEPVLDRFAELVGENTTTAAGQSTADTTTKTKYTISGLVAGYYLVKDVTESGNMSVGDAYTKYILRVVRNVEVSPKGSVPSVTKTVHTAVDGTFKEYEDAAMGHTVYYKLEGTVPSNYTDYAQYKYKFVDTMPAGLTYQNIAAAYILHNNDKTTTIDASAYNVNANEQTLTITFANLKSSLTQLLPGDRIVIKYAAKVNQNAVIGNGSTTGNVNSVVLEYSNNPNEASTVETPSMGKTTADTAKMYTFQLDITKVDSLDTSKPLAGAQFRLYRNEVKEGVTTKVYAVIKDGKVTGTTTSISGENAATVLTTGTDGKISIAGLDSSIYYLEEVKAPDGYNAMTAPVRITITPTYTNNVLDALAYDVDGVPGIGNAVNGVVSVNVKNTAGATLPSTGGVGTTIFYIAGAALMIGAGAVLAAKKRTQK